MPHISIESTRLNNPEYFQLPRRREQGHHARYMFSIMCLSATIFLLLRGHQCLRLLESHEGLTGRIGERLLSVAETGTFRHCFESDAEGERGASGGTGGGAASRATSGAASASSGGTASGASSGPSWRSPSGTASGTSPAAGHVLQAPETPEGSVDRGPHKVPLRAASFRMPGSFGQSKNFPVSPATSSDLQGELGGYRPDVSASNKRLEGTARSMKKPVSEKSVLLDPPLDIGEHARQLELLQLSGYDCFDLTETDLELLHTAEDYLARMLRKRTNLLKSLRANTTKQRLLEARMEGLALDGSTTSAEEQRIFRGALTKLKEEAQSQERLLWRTRRELKTMVPQRQHMALALRLVARRRASGMYLSSKGAAAVSAATLVVKGPKGAHFVATAAEEKEIMKMSRELLTRMRESTEALTTEMDSLEPRSGGRFAAFRIFRAMEKRHEKCKLLQMEASTFILQLRFVLISAPKRQTIEELEAANLQLRRAIDRCSSLLQDRQRAHDPGFLRSLFRRLRIGDF